MTEKTPLKMLILRKSQNVIQNCLMKQEMTKDNDFIEIRIGQKMFQRIVTHNGSEYAEET